MNEIIFDVSGKPMNSESDMKPVKMMNYKAMRENGKYMPDFLIDFHSQKEFFKTLFNFYEVELEKQGKQLPKDYNWVQFHIYSVDILFYTMIKFGYKLRRSPKRLPFLDFYDVSDKLSNYSKRLFYKAISSAGENATDIEDEGEPKFIVDEKLQSWIDQEQHLPDILKGRENQVRFYDFMDKFMDLSDRLELMNCDKNKFMEYGVNALLKNAAKFGFVFAQVKRPGNFEDIELTMTRYGF